MQAAFVPTTQGLCKAHSASRRVLRTPAFTSHTNGRERSVKVFAKKGKGKTALRGAGGVPGQAEMIRRDPPTPDVDPVNAEFVVFVRCKKFIDPMMNKPSTAPSPWVPLSIVKGSQAANFLVKILESEWGKKLYGNTLLRQIAQGVYKDRAEIEKNVRKSYPPFSQAGSKDFEYAFKIRDKSNPKAWTDATNISILPPESELQATGIDQLKQFFSADNIMSMFKSPEAPASNSSSSNGAPQQ